MIRLAATIAVLAGPVIADGQAAIEALIKPAYAELAASSAIFAQTASATCDPTDPTLRATYNAAFDDWLAVSHFRFGPSELDDRAFALAFWPDSRGATPQTLARLIAEEDTATSYPTEFAEVSIAARGFYAMEFMLYDAQFTDAPSDYSCTLIQAIATDIARMTGDLSEDWETFEYREANAAVFNALLTGLEFTATQRLGRPLGTFERPRPNRAEARRSGRSLDNVILSLTAQRDLALILAQSDPVAAERLRAAFDEALEIARNLDDPVFAGVAEVQGRFDVEILQQRIVALRNLAAQEIGPSLGVVAGFNALDGD